jgi:glutamine amidotransferase
MGNVRSVVNALNAVGATVELVSEPEALERADGVVLPGVGAFGEGIARLRQSGLESALSDHVIGRGKPFLGLCLGLQLLATTGLERGCHRGLGWIPGTVAALPIPDSSDFRLPHVGWNDVSTRPGARIFNGLRESEAFYFVHGYVLAPEDPSVVTGKTSYGCDFVASIEWRNVHATQFHPEKSHTAGLRLLRNFVEFSVA